MAGLAANCYTLLYFLLLYFYGDVIVGVEIQCIGHFRLLFSLLRVDGRSKMQQHALEVSAV